MSTFWWFIVIIAVGSAWLFAGIEGAAKFGFNRVERSGHDWTAPPEDAP